MMRWYGDTSFLWLQNLGLPGLRLPGLLLPRLLLPILLLPGLLLPGSISGLAIGELAASPLKAGSASACAIEATQHGRAACLGLLADTRLVALETRLSNITASLQGATASGLIEFEQGLYVDQTRWRREITRECGKASSDLARQTCRLGAIAAREDQIDVTLARAFAPLGHVPGDPVLLTDEVEVVVPLGRPKRGAFPFLSFDIPLTR